MPPRSLTASTSRSRAADLYMSRLPRSRSSRKARISSEGPNPSGSGVEAYKPGITLSTIGISPFIVCFGRGVMGGKARQQRGVLTCHTLSLACEAPFGSLLRTIVVHAKELDHGLCVLRTIHPPAHPSRLGQRRMYRGSPLCYELVAHLLWKGEVCQAGAVQVPQLHPTVTELQAAPASVAGGDPRPALHLTLYCLQRFIVHVIPPRLR